MARNKQVDGFSLDNIVDTIISENTNKENINTDTNINDNVDIVTQIKENVDPEKKRVQLYLDKDVNNLLDYYGKKVGKANGGKSKFTTELLKRALNEKGLWNEKIANKK